MIDNQATGEQAALHFFRTQELVWKEWLELDAFRRVKASYQ